MSNEQAEQQTNTYLTKVAEEKGFVMQILRQDDNSIVDISTLASDITHTTSLLDQPGKLTFFIQKDPNQVLKSVKNGDVVMFRKDGYGIFKGYIFTIGTDVTNVFKITAYDQTRYLKNEDFMQLTGKMTVSEIFNKICTENGITGSIITPCNYVPPKKLYQNATMYSILRDCFRHANVDTKQIYMIKDNYGVLELRTIDSLKTNIEIGSGNILTSYQYETSIDKATYTRFKLLKKSSAGNADSDGNYVVYNTPKVDEFEKRWGVLQKVQNVNDNLNKKQVEEMANNLLKQYCRETKTLTLSALGIHGFFAGIGFKLNLPDLGASVDMWVLEASHRYTQDFHTMDLTVNANDLELYWK